jgi:DNA-binding NarL/FixJ family response regulator
MRILLIEDHELVRKGIGYVFAQNPGFEIIGEFDNPIPAIDFMRKKENLPDIIISDINTPNMNGLEGCKEIRKEFPKVKLLILSSHKDYSYIKEAIELELDGYVLKDEIADELVKALSEIYSGKKYFSQEIISLALKRYEKQKREKKNTVSVNLTTREIEVLQLISEGRTNKEIADLLHISQKTVETHRASMLKKMQAKNSIDMIRKAVDLKLIR